MQNWQFWVLVVGLVLTGVQLDRRFDQLEQQFRDLRDVLEDQE